MANINKFELHYPVYKHIRRGNKVVKEILREDKITVDLVFDAASLPTANIQYGFNSKMVDCKAGKERYKLHKSITPKSDMRLVHIKTGRIFTFKTIVISWPYTTVALIERNKVVATLTYEDYYKD